MRALRLFGDDEAQRVFTTVGPEQEYFLIDEQYFFERPDLITTGRTLFGAKPPKGHELDDHYFGSIPERVLACMLEVEHELRKLGVPIKTRHNEVAPGQYEIAPIFENSNVGSDHQQLTHAGACRASPASYGLVCLLHEKPFAGVNGSGKHNNWSMGTDTGAQPARARATRPHDNMQFLFFCAAVIQAVNKHQGLLRASVADIGQDHRLGANEAPPAIISIFLGAELDEGLRGDRRRARATPHTPGSFLGLGTPVLPPLPMHGGDRNRTSPVRLHRQQVRVPRARVEHVARLPEHGAQHDRRRGDRRPRRQARGEAATAATSSTSAVTERRQGRPTRPTSRSCFDGDNYAEAWHAEAEKRGLKNLRTTPDALPEVLAEPTRRGVRASTRCSPSASSSPATRSGSSSTSITRQHRGRDRRVDRRGR